MKKNLCRLVALTAAVVLLPAGVALAGVVGSKHDMGSVGGITWTTGQGSAGACSFCHIPHKATGAKLWSGAPQGTAGTVGTIGTLCADCHLPGTGKFFSDNNVGASKLFFNVTGTTVASASHGLLKANIPTNDADLSAGVTGLKYTTTASEISGESGMIQCTSCHDPHNDALDPFIDADGGGTYHELCKKCHTGRDGATMGFTGTLGSHPVGNSLTDAAEGAENPVTYGSSFNRALRNGTQTSGSEAPWVAGGHTATGGANAGIQCGTCHAVHGLEATDQTSVTAYGVLLSAGTRRAGTHRWDGSINLLAMANNDYEANALCQGCHTDQADGGTGITNYNPGAASTYSHPINMAVDHAAVDDYNPQTTAIPGTNGTAVALCRSCHGVHTKDFKGPGIAATPLLVAAVSSLCDTCHPTSEGFIANHHPANTAWVGTMATVANNATTIAATTPTGGLNVTAWGTSQLECYNCHRAHNGNTSLLRMTDKNAMCLVCHTENPCVGGSVSGGALNGNDSGQTATGGSGSHYIGSITTTNYKFTGTWEGSGGTSEYGTGGNGTIICLSCHNLMNQVIPSQHRLLGGYGNNFVPADGNVGLCRTCHKPAQDTLPTAADSWGTGWTHPNTAASVIQKTHPLEKNSAGALVNTTANTIGSGATVTYSTGTVQVNCESCHVAHCAVTGTGSLILEKGVDPDGAGALAVGPTGDAASDYNTKPTTKNEDGFCKGCHTL